MTWIPKIIWIYDEKFIIDESKNLEVKYPKIYNTKPVGEFNLLPQQITGILHLPMFIEMDYTLSITRIEGYFKINYDDLFGNHYSTHQGYHIFTNYKDEIPSIHVTFLNSFNSEKDWKFEE